MLREVIGEFGRHLDMLAEQLGASVQEADRECVTVGQSFHELSAAKGVIEGISRSEACPAAERAELAACCEQIGVSIHDAVVALQYHDRLAQRLGLVRAGLDRLQTLLREGSPRSYDAWLESLRNVERINRTEQRRLGPAAGQTDTEPDTLAQSSVELF